MRPRNSKKPHIELHHRRWDGRWDVCIEIPRKKRGLAKLPIVDVYWRGSYADVPSALADARNYIPTVEATRRAIAESFCIAGRK